MPWCSASWLAESTLVYCCFPVSFILYPTAASSAIVARPLAVPVLFPVLSLSCPGKELQSPFHPRRAFASPLQHLPALELAEFFALTVFCESCQCQSCPGHSTPQLPFANHPGLRDQSLHVALQKTLLLKVSLWGLWAGVKGVLSQLLSWRAS